MEKILTQSYKSPLGELVLGVFQDRLCLCDWKFRKMRQAVDERLKKGLNAEMEEGSHPVLEQTISQLDEFFTGKRKDFSIPLLTVGTDFQKSVWDSLLAIPFGETRSYLQLSQDLGNPDAIRAVASANGANAISILIPCHRIIGSDGSLVGYAGGLDAKKKLLKLEGAKSAQPQGQIPLF
ncbi:methylated-DNA-[protein]-cysteine S-methyltransferase [Algoriphagus boseongensis]|uniref:Methylated-DNA--protein-cysteine methyltransferase n=1 Tax=Algoriphagus boseongensis TaxID=1442587 RepID=A0A4R6T7X5_9BACT|nr:methylated-DNA--[protein]-cysteine S-methyltransferase [Algoriphagus boseongensis]TDQ18279.1 methylated-DNA-[protein]-cysteine S-methyltransferase [Algoriphagus boseongensis]